MRKSIGCLLFLALFSGCSPTPVRLDHTVSPSKDNTWTSDAVLRGDFEAVRKRVIDDPGYLHERDYVGSTPLLNAIAIGNLELVRFLIEQGADPNAPVDDGYTCLLTAVESDAADSTLVVAELIQAGADIHATGTNGWTPLHMAAARGYAEKARLLIGAGAEVNRRTEIDASETPLMEAASMGHPEVVRLLLEHGADPTMRDTVHGRTPLASATYMSKGPDPDVVAYLKRENIRIDVDQLFGNMDLPPEQLEVIKNAVKETDLAENYINNATELARTGNHAEVIRILTELR